MINMPGYGAPTPLRMTCRVCGKDRRLGFFTAAPVVSDNHCRGCNHELVEGEDYFILPGTGMRFVIDHTMPPGQLSLQPQ